MGPWNKILTYARDINRKVGTTLTTEKAKKIRNNLLIWGAVITVLSAVGVVVGIVVMFSGFTNFSSSMMVVGQTALSIKVNCPEMGEPGWFECESGNMQEDFNNSKTQMKNDFSNVASSSFLGFGIVAVSGFLLSFGVILIKAGLAILIVGEGAKFLDTAKKCPNCGDSVEDNEIYCNKCGADLRNKVKCSACGTQNEIDDKFCRNCGKEL